MDLDLDGFDINSTDFDVSSTEEDVVTSRFKDAQSALLYIDDNWYRERNRRGRQMDLIGEYAGAEPFVLDGSSPSSFTTRISS